MKVAIIGHREIDKGQELRERLSAIIEALICERQADTFLFGSKSGFDDLCYQVVTRLKDRYPLRRIYVRSSFEYISDEYLQYLLSLYEETVFPDTVRGAGRAAYVKRNQAMIDMCDCLLVYYDEKYGLTVKRKSGTKLAYTYAEKKRKEIINVLIK